MQDGPFMPKATAVWLVQNTTLSFKQIANFCKLHELEIKGIADGDVVLMEPIKDRFSLRNGDVVSALVPGLGTTLKYFFKRGEKIFLEAANPNYETIELNKENVVFQGKLLAVWRKV